MLSKIKDTELTAMKGEASVLVIHREHVNLGDSRAKKH